MASAAKPAKAIQVFYSYAHEDAELREELDKHLSLLERSGLIQDWHDRKIGAGAAWAGEIDDHLRRAEIVLLLISADFLASDYCFDVEMRLALERHAAGQARVIPVILRPCDWQGAPFSHLQCLPTGALPVTLWASQDAAFRDVASGIRRAVEEMNGRPRPIVAKRKPPGVTQPQPRMLDAALPARVTVGRTAELVAMVRRTESGGLRAVLRIDDEYAVQESDVRSKEFKVRFPVGEEGTPREATLDLEVEAAGFNPERQVKRISVPPDDDSEVCVFLMTPERTGPLAVKLEVRYADVSVISRLLRTNSGEITVEGAPSFVLTSMPFHVVSFTGVAVTPAPGAGPHPPASRPPNAREDTQAIPEAARPESEQPPAHREVDPRSRRATRPESAESWGSSPSWLSSAFLRRAGLAATILLAALIAVQVGLLTRSEDGGETTSPIESPPAQQASGDDVVATLFALEQTQRFAAFVAASEAVSLFDSGVPCTVLAPTDEAFERAGLEQQAAMGRPAHLIVQEYVFPGALTVEDLEASGSVTSLAGWEYEVRATPGRVHIGPARIIRGDIRAGASMIHIVDLEVVAAPFGAPLSPAATLQ